MNYITYIVHQVCEHINRDHDNKLSIDKNLFLTADRNFNTSSYTRFVALNQTQEYLKVNIESQHMNHNFVFMQ